MVILDTNVISALMRPAENLIVVKWLDELAFDSIWTTSVNVLEVRFGLMLMADGRKRTDLVSRFDALLSRELNGRIAPFDVTAAERAATISASRRRAGRPVESSDVQIAGIALSRNWSVATRNARDFDDIGLRLIDPWSIQGR